MDEHLEICDCSRGYCEFVNFDNVTRSYTLVEVKAEIENLAKKKRHLIKLVTQYELGKEMPK